ncbi:stabilizer of axonemal microtubules 2 [Trichomycterus rosablanca]|uniref:stabilizer of axonemal microtubules 2 n=1 Tax=Trichomycterus rosablanca TaxID=2290929 RepID=UPI002F35F931
MKKVCICNICNCGRHRCTRQPTDLYGKSGHVCVVSEYTEKYPTYQSCRPPQSLKPKPEEKGERSRMEGTTTFRSDFVPYEVTRRPGRQRPQYQPRPGQIDLSTTYSLEFNPYEVKPISLARPKERNRGADGKLDTVPTYKEDFRQWEITRREPPKPRTSYHPPVEKFGNATTFQDEFVPRGPVVRESFKPPNAPKQSDVPLDGVTSHQLSYVPHRVEPRYIRPPPEYKPSEQPFQDLTTHRLEYQGLPGTAPKSCKPERLQSPSDAPFQSSTEFRERFQAWAVPPPRAPRAPEYTSPTQDMDLTTTTQTTYVRHRIQPFVPAKPFLRHARSSAPFQADTTTKEDFKPWTPQRRTVACKPSEMPRASGRMEDLSTFRAHYIQHQLQPNPSCKPLAAPLRSQAPLEEGTVYRTEFTPKKIKACPASSEAPPGFVFERVDDAGHRFYRRVSARDQVTTGHEVETPKAVAIMA